MKQYQPVSLAALTVIAIAAAALPSCTDHSRHRIAFASPDEEAFALPAAQAKPTTDGRVVIVTIDGVRAEDVFDGADRNLQRGAKVAAYARPEAVMPRTHRLFETRGVGLGANRLGCGTVRTASGANVSLPGYLEIFTGRKTACRDNDCDRTTLTTVLDQASDAGLAPVMSIGSWEMLVRATTKGTTAVLTAEGTRSWPAARPLEDPALERLVAAGEKAAPYPGSGEYRPDASTMAIALEYLKTAHPPLLHVGLGDPDEYGHKNDYRAYLEAIGRADAFIGAVSDALDGMGEIGAKTTVIVTTDHGRNRNFQHHGAFSASSGRTFVLAFGPRVPVRGVVCSPNDVTLADIAPTVRELMGLRADTSPEAGHPIEEIAGTKAAAVAHAGTRLGTFPKD